MEKKKQSKMRGGVLLGIALLLIISLLVGACAKAPAPATPAPGMPAPTVTVTATATPAPAQVFKLKYGSWLPVTQARWLGDGMRFADELEFASGGRIKLERVPGAQLASATDQYAALKNGIMDIAHSSPLTNMPFDDPVKYAMALVPMTSTLIGGIVITTLWERYFGPHCIKPMEPAKYVKSFGMAVSSALAPAFKTKEVTKLADWKGLKIRADGTAADMVAALGATPVRVLPDDMYQALTSGLVEAVMYLPANFKVYGVTDACKYWIPKFVMPFAGLRFDIMVNVATYNRLPADLQQIINVLGRRIQWWVEQIYEELDWNAAATAAKAGMKQIDVPADELAKWNELIVKATLDQSMAKLKGMGYPAEEIYELIKAMKADYEKTGPFTLWEYERKAEAMVAKYKAWPNVK